MYLHTVLKVIAISLFYISNSRHQLFVERSEAHGV